MARLLLDEGLPLRAAGCLRGRGIDAVHAHEIGLASASDERILALRSVLIRAQLTGFLEVAEWIHWPVRDLDSRLESGVAVTSTKRGTRFRKLPLR